MNIQPVRSFFDLLCKRKAELPFFIIGAWLLFISLYFEPKHDFEKIFGIVLAGVFILLGVFFVLRPSYNRSTSNDFTYDFYYDHPLEIKGLRKNRIFLCIIPLGIIAGIILIFVAKIFGIIFIILTSIIPVIEYLKRSNERIIIYKNEGKISVVNGPNIKDIILGNLISIRLCIGYKSYYAYLVGSNSEFLLATAFTARNLFNKIEGIAIKLNLPVNDEMG